MIRERFTIATDWLHRLSVWEKDMFARKLSHRQVLLVFQNAFRRGYANDY